MGQKSHVKPLSPLGGATKYENVAKRAIGVIPAKAGIQVKRKPVNPWMPDQVRHDGEQMSRERN
jgi:hypothetical protein